MFCCCLRHEPDDQRDQENKKAYTNTQPCNHNARHPTKLRFFESHLAAICHRSEGNHPTDNGPPGETLHEHFFSEQSNSKRVSGRYPLHPPHEHDPPDLDLTRISSGDVRRSGSPEEENPGPVAGPDISTFAAGLAAGSSPPRYFTPMLQRRKRRPLPAGAVARSRPFSIRTSTSCDDQEPRSSDHSAR